MNTLPREVVHYIFSFLTPKEITGIMHLSKKFNWAGQAELHLLLRRNGINIPSKSLSLEVARSALTKPITHRLSDLYCILSDLENFFKGEEWNISRVGKSRLLGSPDSPGATYETDYIPLTLRGAPHLSIPKDHIRNIRGERFDLGYYLKRRNSSGKAIKYTEVVDALKLLKAIRALIAWLGRQRHQFLILPDGTKLS